MWFKNSCPIDTAVASLISTMVVYPAGLKALEEANSLDVSKNPAAEAILQCLQAVYHLNTELLPDFIEAARKQVQGIDNWEAWHNLMSFVAPIITALSSSEATVACGCQVHNVEKRTAKLCIMVPPQDNSPTAIAAVAASRGTQMAMDASLSHSISYNIHEDHRMHVNPATVLQESMLNHLQFQCQVEGCGLKSNIVPETATLNFDGPIVADFQLLCQ